MTSHTQKVWADANAKAGQHSDENGPFEVWYNQGNLVSHPGPPEGEGCVSDIEAPGWYWWSCSPGCLPDGNANGPFNTSTEAWEDAKVGDYDEDGDGVTDALIAIAKASGD